MKFTQAAIGSVFSEPHISPGIWRERFLCGGLLLTLGGWVALHPPPKAPDLPSACRTRFRREPAERAVTVERGFSVWLDTRYGIYYYSTSPHYGKTPDGRFIDLRDAKRSGYRRGGAL
jgi:hypothetical protein